MEPYHEIIPEDNEPNMTLVLDRKVGRVPKGRYTFFECYCTDPGCDCRRTTILVFNEKAKQKAGISFGFDPEQPLAGPFLDEFQQQAPYAEELLDFFVEAINADPGWLNRMYDQYRLVRRMVDGRAYRGKPFPKPGKVKRRKTSPPSLEAELERMFGEPLPPQSKRKQQKPGTPVQVGPSDGPDRSSRRDGAGTGASGGMVALLDLYLLGRRQGRYPDLQPVQDELRRYLLSHDRAGDELAELLAASFAEDDRGEACLRLLLDALEILRVELERRRPGSKRRMEGFQGALARRIFLEDGGADLCASVTHALLESRVEILPVLHDANQRRMMEDAERMELPAGSEQEIVAGLFRTIEEMGLPSPFEGVEAMLQLFVLGDPGMQVALTAHMLAAPTPLIREIAGLMLCHPSAEVRLGVSEVLAKSEGRSFTPEMLRRLIISRNWFGAGIRDNLDRAVGNARRGRVDCAPLVRPSSMQVYASVIDAAGAQSVQVMIPDGKGFTGCSLLLKQGVGVADAFVVPMKNKRELNEFLAMLKGEESFLESTPEYLDQRVCHALAEGVRLGNAPPFWLVRIAELLGRDQWKAVELAPREELTRLRGELASASPKLLSDRETADALAASAEWPFAEEFGQSWFEDDLTLDRAVEGAKGSRRKQMDPLAAISRILDDCLSMRRELWLERLVLAILWLRSAKKPPVPWHRMFHVAEAVADGSRPLKEIPLMLSIAERSLEAYFGRRERSN